MHFVVVDTHRFVTISRHIFCYRRCCNIYVYFSLLLSSFFFSFFFFLVELYNLIHLINVYI